jgi:hypothetical protein
MKVYRLVDSDHDPTDVGAFLTRCSDHSKQKLGSGMYFAATRKDALAFAAKHHGHKYSHILTCDLKGVQPDDLVDLVAEPFLIAHSEFKNPVYAQRCLEYAMKYGKKGIIWKAVSGWIEVCLFAEHVPGSVVIEAAEPLPPPAPKPPGDGQPLPAC